MQEASDSRPADSDQAPSERPGRPVRSYVLRAGRTTAAQQRALFECWPRFGVAFEPRPLDLNEVFGRRAARTLEIGFGNGEHLLARACAEPERDFLGVEVHRPGVGHLLLQAAAADLSNVRVIAHDAVEVLRCQIACDSLDEIQILFPDPWPKKRHHKRRLVQPAFVALLASRLRPQGRLHLATDWAPYAEQIRDVLSASAAFVPLDPALADARVSTRFERRGERLGHRVEELLAARGEAALTLTHAQE